MLWDERQEMGKSGREIKEGRGPEEGLPGCLSALYLDS